MKDQHTKITGYRDLSQAEIDLMNEIKAKGEELRALVRKINDVAMPPLKEIVAAPDEDTGTTTVELDVAEWDPLKEGDSPLFWIRTADCNFRTGIMAAVRAVAQPTSY